MDKSAKAGRFQRLALMFQCKSSRAVSRQQLELEARGQTPLCLLNEPMIPGTNEMWHRRYAQQKM
jgi:hypothetical protein